jgi:hypothetical protein
MVVEIKGDFDAQQKAAVPLFQLISFLNSSSVKVLIPNSLALSNLEPGLAGL